MSRRPNRPRNCRLAKPGIDALLIDCVLDPPLLQRMFDKPLDVFADYDISEEDRDILSSPDERLLGLLGRVVGTTAVGATPETAGKAHTKETMRSLPESRLALRLVPYLQRAPEPLEEGQPPIIVSYLGHLDPLPAGVGVEDLPPVPQADVPGHPLAPLALVVAARPLLSGAGGDSIQVGFSLRTEMPATPSPSLEGGEASLSPWSHDTTSATVRDAADKVRTAAPEDRHDRLLQLVAAVVRPLVEPSQ